LVLEDVRRTASQAVVAARGDRSQMSCQSIQEFSDSRSMAALTRSFVRHARYRYRIGPNDAEDLVQSSVATYLERGEKFADVPNHNALLFGIFRKKCLEHIDRSVRERRKLRRMCMTADAARENPWIRPSRTGESPGVLESLVRDEERQMILQAVASLRPKSQELVTLIVDDGVSRQGLIELTGLNTNTLDSRLHVCRNELRDRLRERSLFTLDRVRPDDRRERRPGVA
jgi:RNA polymerase sigma factor (sigma-70 family)